MRQLTSLIQILVTNDGARKLGNVHAVSEQLNIIFISFVFFLSEESFDFI